MVTPAAIHRIDKTAAVMPARAVFPNPPRTYHSLRENGVESVDSKVEKPQTISRSMTAAGILLACSAITLFLVGSPAASHPEALQEATKEGTKEAIQVWAFDIFPLAGAMLAAAGICLLHNVGEGKAKISGRVVFALIGGFVAPWVVAMLPLTWQINDPRGQLLIGVIFGSIGYIFSRYFVEVVFRRALGITERVVDAGEKKLDKKLGD